MSSADYGRHSLQNQFKRVGFKRVTVGNLRARQQLRDLAAAWRESEERWRASDWYRGVGGNKNGD